MSHLENDMKRRAVSLGIADRVTFHGLVADDQASGDGIGGIAYFNSTIVLTIVFLVSVAQRGLPGISGEICVVIPIGLVGLAWAVPAVWQEYLHMSPTGILWHYIPSLRVNSRAVVLLQLGLAVLSGAGLEPLIGGSRMRRRPTWQRASGQIMTANSRRRGWLFSGVAAAIFLFESIRISNAANPLPHPAVNDCLASLPRGTVIMQYSALDPA